VHWKKCKIELKQLSMTNGLAEILFAKFRERSKQLYEENVALFCALYIDPRFNSRNQELFPSKNEQVC
jgi:hypothetical protein